MREFNEKGERVEPPKKKRWGFFANYMKDGKGVKKEDVITDYNFINFFKLYGRRFWKLLWVNALYIFGNFPILFFLLAQSGYFSDMGYAPASEIFPIVNGIAVAAGGLTPATSVLMGIHGGMSAIFANNVATYILLGISALFILTFGPVNAGCTYIVKNLVKGEHVFMWQDFIGAIKANWKQAIPMGILDLLMTGLCLYSFNVYYVNYENYYVMFYCMLLVMLLYGMMRFYLYSIMVTFEQGFFKIIKNAMIFCILAFGRNLVMMLAIITMGMLIFALGSVFLPLAVIGIFLLFFSTSAFMGMYAAYPKIKKYMIDPYYTKQELDASESYEA